MLDDGEAEAGLAGDAEPAAVTENDMLDDGEAEAGAADLTAPPGIDPVEALGQPRDVLGGDAVALVGHAQRDQVRIFLLDPDPDLASRPAIFERVDDEVGQHLRG